MLTLFIYLIAALIALLLLVSLGLKIAYRPPRDGSTHTPQDEGIDYQDISLTTEKGNTLRGWFLPQPEPAPSMIILHGWGASASLMLPLATPLYHAGFNILLFDARNHGHSDSEGQSALPRFAEDLHLAIAWLQNSAQHHNGQIVLTGHSVGAGAVLLEASRRQDIAAVISLSAFAHPEWLMRRQLQQYKLPTFVIKILLAHIQWIIRAKFEVIAPMNTACKIHCPVLLVHGDRDKMVPISDAYAIRDHCADKSLPLLVLNGGGHNPSGKIKRHLPEVLQFLRKAGLNLPAESLIAR